MSKNLVRTVKHEIRGPRVDAPDASFYGWSNFITKTYHDFEIVGRNTPKGEFYYAIVFDHEWVDTDEKEVRRSKKVDVPTEQWMKSIERRLEALEKMKTIPTSAVDKFMGEK